MSSPDDQQKAAELEKLMTEHASAFPGNDASPYVDVAAELRRVCDWLCEQQTGEGLWPEHKVNLRFYSDAYAVRALLAAAHLFSEKRYLDAACRWLKYMVKTQRADGGWWVGYGMGDHDWQDKNVDQSVVYVADAGEVSLALVDAYHFLSAKGDALADDLKQALLHFRDFTDHFRLRSGAMGLGYTHRDFYAGHVARPFMQAHHRTFPFATAATGVNFYAGLYTITGDPDDWEKAMQSLDWCLEHMGSQAKPGGPVESNDNRDVIALHRVGDWAFDCSNAPRDKAPAEPSGTPEPRYASSERQKLYAVWKYMMHFVADLQSDLGEWPVMRNNKPLMIYEGSMRHRMYFLYSLTSYLRNGDPVAGEDDRLAAARDRQLWLCADGRILNEHYGVCLPGVHVMTSGLYAMSLAEMLEAGITLPNGIRRLTGETA